MANNVQISTAARNAACDALTALLDVGGTGTIEIRTGAQPATPATADSGTLLATLTFAATAFGAAATGVCTAAAISSVSAGDTGTAGHFRMKNNAGTVVLQGTCGLNSGTFDLEFDDTSIISGGTVDITAFTITVPE